VSALAAVSAVLALGSSTTAFSAGSTWKAQPVSLGGSGVLTAASCPSTSNCIAVGDAANGPGTAVAQQWNADAWSAMTVPAPSGSSGTAFYGVWCTAVASCVAVGYFDGQNGAAQPLIEQLHGAVWSIVVSPSVGDSASLKGVTCSSASRCFAVGSVQLSTGAAETALAEQWNGSRWRVITASSPSGASWSELTGISCASKCLAVG
jgi:hypothetical protein